MIKPVLTPAHRGPASLTDDPDRSQLQQIIAGLSEGVILVEPDRTITYANEAALSMHGAARLAELGANVSDYRRNFVLRYRNHHPLGREEYPIERAVAGEAFRDVLVDVTRAGSSHPEWVHRVRSLVIRDEAGRLDCLVLIVHDATELYEAERRFQRAFSANPAPAAICRLSDLRFVRVNEGFLGLTGFAREDVIGRSVYEVDVLREAERRELAIERLKEGRTIPQMEACLRVPADCEKFVIVAGQPIEMPGDEACMLFTFADLEDRRKAEMALKHSEERFAKAFQLTPIPTALVRLDGFVLEGINDAFAATFGYREEDVGGLKPAALALWVDLGDQQAFERGLKRTGSVRSFEARLHGRDGAELDCLISAEAVTIDDERCVLCVMQDITARKRSETELIAAIEAVMADASWFSRGIIEKLAALRRPAPAGQAAPPAAGLDDLTAREHEVLTLICRGASDGDIGAELNLSRNTVRNHVAAIYKKLGVNRRSAVVIWGRERGQGGDRSNVGERSGVPRGGRKRPGRLV